MCHHSTQDPIKVNHTGGINLVLIMDNTFISEQTHQLETADEMQTCCECVELSDNENQEIDEDYFFHKNTEISIPGRGKKTLGNFLEKLRV